MNKDQLEKTFLNEYITLSHEHTNHSIRSTVIKNLDAANFEARHIIQLQSKSMHQNVQMQRKKKCLKHCQMWCYRKKHKNQQQTKQTSTAVTSTDTCDTTPNIQDVKENLPTFDLDPIDYLTIDDSILQDLLTSFPQKSDNTNNSNNNSVTLPPKNSVQVPVTQNNQQFNNTGH